MKIPDEAIDFWFNNNQNAKNSDFLRTIRKHEFGIFIGGLDKTFKLVPLTTTFLVMDKIDESTFILAKKIQSVKNFFKK